MRLPVALGAIAVATWAAAARADSRTAAWTAIYLGDDGLTVISPRAFAKVGVRPDVDVVAGVDLDVITAATIDVVTSASPRGYTENRFGFLAGAVWRPATGTTVGLRYVPSFERDYESQGLSASASREWIDRRLTTRIEYRLALDQVGRAGAARETWRPLATNVVGLGVGWVFGARTVGDLLYEVQLLDGYQASPYRNVWLGGLNTPIHEQVPDQRARHALALRLRRALTPHWFALGYYRLYADTWSIVAHTVEAEIQWAPRGDRLTLGASVRGYQQSAASFYRENYVVSDLRSGPPVYRAQDKVLANSWSFLGALRADWALDLLGSHDLRLVLRIDWYEQEFLDFRLLAHRRAFVGSVGANLTF